MPLLNESEVRRLLADAAQPRAECRGCGQLIVTDYCRTCDEFYRLGHAPFCPSEFAWAVAGETHAPDRWSVHWGHRTYLVPFVESSAVDWGDARNVPARR